MKTIIRLILLAAALALGCWLWSGFFPGPEKAIRKKMSALAETATLDGQANAFARVAKALSFQSYFSSNAVIVVDVPELGAHTLNSRFEIVEQSNLAFAALPGMKVSFHDTTVRIGSDQQTAEVNCTVQVMVGREKDFGVQELRFRFEKINGDWLITRVETVKTLT